MSASRCAKARAAKSATVCARRAEQQVAQLAEQRPGEAQHRVAEQQEHRQDEHVLGPRQPVDDALEHGEPATVEGVRGVWRVDPAQLGQPFEGRTALLSPFDRLVHDRKRMVELFEFDYSLEMYKPAAKRRWGYFALPILHGDRLVGKIDATADRKAGVLRVDAIHQDAPFTRRLTTEVRREIDDLARWLDLDLTLPS